MESTGVYWKPVWHVLEDVGGTHVLANAMHIRNLPGRKTDVNDATWIADLLAHGLIRASFVPRLLRRSCAISRTRKRPCATLRSTHNAFRRRSRTPTSRRTGP